MEQYPLIIPSNTKTILPGQYAGQPITEIIFPETVEEIGEGAFAGCPELTRLWIPRSVKHIGAKAFWGCGKLRRVFIPDCVETIGHDAFDYRDCEIFCEAPSRPAGWYCDYYEEMGYDDYEGQMIVSLYESWCGYDIEVSCPEWASGSLSAHAEPCSLRWSAVEEEVRAIWEQEEWVLERSETKRTGHSIQDIRDSNRRYEESELTRIEQKIEAAKQKWLEASAFCHPENRLDRVACRKEVCRDSESRCPESCQNPEANCPESYQGLPAFYPESLKPAAIVYINALKELKHHHAGNHDIFKDYEAGWEVFRVYCELAPRFEDPVFRKGLDDMKAELERLVYYGAGTGGGSALERERISNAYNAAIAAIKG